MASPLSYHVKRRPWYVGVAVLLIVLLAATWGVRAWRVADVADEVEERQARETAQALAYAQQDFAERQERLLERAQALAEQAPVIRGLRALDRDRGAEARERLVRHVASLELPDRMAVEVYDPIPRMLAWKGFSIPLDEAPNTAMFLREPQTAIATDDDLRSALAAWWPVRDGARVVGVVRVMEAVRFRAPVQNQYIGDFSLAADWRRATGLPVQVRFGAGGWEAPSRAHTAELTDRHETVVGHVIVLPPPAGRLVQEAAAYYDGWLALWGTLLAGWLLVGMGLWYCAARGDPADGDGHRQLSRSLGRFLVLIAGWWGFRYLLLLIEVPARWISPAGPLAPLFDPTHLASAIGGGLMRSTAELLLTGGFAFVTAAAVLDLAAQFRDKGFRLDQLRRRLSERGAEVPSLGRFLLVVGAFSTAALGVTLALAALTQRAVLDSTLDYFARTGLLPDLLALVVFCALLLLTIAAVLVIAGLAWMGLWLLARYWPSQRRITVLGLALVVLALPFGVAYVGFGAGALVAWPVAAAMLLVGMALAGFGFIEPATGLELLTLRRLLPALLLVTVLLYPILYHGMDTQRRARVVDAAESFSEGRDPRVLFSIEQVLQELRADPAVRNMLAETAPEAGEQQRAQLDSLAEEVLRGSLLTSLGTYRVTLALYDEDETLAGRYTVMGPSVGRIADETDPIEFDILRQMYAEMGTTGTMVEQVTGPRERDRFQYAGLVPLGPAAGAEEAADAESGGWAVVWAEPQTLLPEAGTPFPRVLLPAGYYGDLYAHFALAEFRDDVLVRSLGRDFGRYRLDEEVRQALRTQSELWRIEEVKGRTFLTYYQRQATPSVPGIALQMAQPAGTSVTGVRVPAVITFDHLYYILRLFVAGLFIGGLLYLLGLYLRWRRGRLPAPRVRFRDKMQNAFLIVGAVSVVVVGFIGMQVLTDENRRATQDWLRQRLEQVEEALVLEARTDEPPYRVMERIGLDSLSVRVGLDLNLYQGTQLMASSRPRLVRDRLISDRLPVEAYQALYFDGYRFTTTQEEVGNFAYTAGFRALTDEEGRPRYVLSVPTLPEQERIEEERARTVAYLFGALLLLVVVVMLTASLLAGALARPMARLRAGLEAVGKGEFARTLPVETRDEIGELVQTFNEMRDQLAESRRKLAHQERELAWREMARQVAHEIKNPLTPMKLSVQHLRRAFKRLEVPAAADGDGEEQRFAELFDRITATLIEQIDALVRIANEFSSFARLPTRVPELLDLNEVISEAVSLMQEEAGVEIDTALHPEPLVVKADQEELRRVYINLVKNAIQAIPEHQEGRIEVTTMREEGSADGRPGRARSTVRDNGTGIPPELRERIFQPNFSTKNSGTGLGLAIVKKSIEDMRGKIGFETEEGQGTTFWLELPLAEEG